VEAKRRIIKRGSNKKEVVRHLVAKRYRIKSQV
jgi:hypothetical protein